MQTDPAVAAAGDELGGQQTPVVNVFGATQLQATVNVAVFDSPLN